MKGTTIENVRVFDGTGLTAPRSVHLDGARIVADAVPGARVLDAGGATLLPGLIDTHLHVETRAELDACARWGVTTALDMGTPRPGRTLPLRHLDGTADLFSTGCPAVAPGSRAITRMGYPADAGVAGPGDAEAFVRARVRDGVDHLKVVVEDPRQRGVRALDPATVEALVRAGHRQGLTVIAHAVTEATYRTAVDAGADVMTHVPIEAVLGDDLAGRAPLASPTLVMMRGVCAALGRRPVVRVLSALRVMPRIGFANAVGSTRSLHRAGAVLLAGTDANSDATAPFSPPHGRALHDELRLLVTAGLSPVEALRAATAVPAEVFGLADRGAVVPGRRADLLLVDGDPTADIASTERIRHVWAGGTLVR